MKHIKCLAIACFFVFSAGFLWSAPENRVDVSTLDRVTIQYKGRLQPLKAFALSVTEAVYGRAHVKGLPPTAFLLELLVRPDIWYATPIIKIDYAPLKRAVGLSEGEKYFSAEALGNNKLLLDLIRSVEDKSERNITLTPLDRRAQLARSAMYALDAVMSGGILQIVPPTAQDATEWQSIREAGEMAGGANDELVTGFGSVLAAYTSGNQSLFDESVHAFSETLFRLNPAAYPEPWRLDWELRYYALTPFLWSWVFYLMSGVVLLLAWRIPRPIWSWLGGALFAVGFTFHTTGILIRMLVLSRPPVSNMYESVIFMTWGICFFSIIFSAVHRRLVFLNTAAFVGAGVLILGNLMPFDSSLDLLVPVLRSNYWLTIHVLTIVSSYAAFAVAMGLGHVTLGRFIWAPNDIDSIKDATHLTYRAVQVGVILLAAGTILGGVWANESWGRFWGWDPKETWALISLLGYLALLHARHTGWIREFGFAVGVLACFLLIVMTWYGVNFVLGKGLHSYGFGMGGGYWIVGFTLIECALMAGSWMARRRALGARSVTRR